MKYERPKILQAPTKVAYICEFCGRPNASQWRIENSVDFSLDTISETRCLCDECATTYIIGHDMTKEVPL